MRRKKSSPSTEHPRPTFVVEPRYGKRWAVVAVLEGGKKDRPRSVVDDRERADELAQKFNTEPWPPPGGVPSWW